MPIKLTITIDPHPATAPETVERMKRALPDVLRNDLIILFRHLVKECDKDGKDPEVSVLLA